MRLEILRDGKPLTLDAKVGEYVPAKAEGEHSIRGWRGHLRGHRAEFAAGWEGTGVLIVGVDSGSPPPAPVCAETTLSSASIAFFIASTAG